MTLKAVAVVPTTSATPSGPAGGDLTGTYPNPTIAVGAVTDAKSSLMVKPAVAVVSTANLALTGEQTIDGILTVGSLVLLTGQSTGSQNGPWVSAAGAWARPAWFVSGSTTQAPQFCWTLVRLGTLYQGSIWRMTTAAVTIDTTATTWTQTPVVLSATSVANGVTGTGAAVLATSPTLVTPALGTPASGTLTNATGLPIGSGVSGLGAGVATLLGGASSGTGGPAGTTSPTFTTPVLGVATATSVAATNLNGTLGATTPAAITATTITQSGNSFDAGVHYFGSTTPTTSNFSAYVAYSQMAVNASWNMVWSPTAGQGNLAAADVGIARNAIGVLEINSGTNGVLRDLTARNGTFAGALNLTLSQSASTNITVSNVNGGTAATAGVSANNDGSTGYIQMVAVGTAFTTNGAYTADAGVIETGAGMAGGMNIVARVAPIRFYAGGIATGNIIANWGTATVTVADPYDFVLGTTTGTKIGTATSQKLAFHNATPVVQRVGAAQTAVVTTASTNVTPFGFATAAQADAIVTLVNELRAAAVEKGLIKGAA